VLLLNPNLVPQVVNVVIGENLYELKFRVEVNPNGSAPQLMEMNGQHEGGGAGENTGGDGRGNTRQMGQQYCQVRWLQVVGVLQNLLSVIREYRKIGAGWLRRGCSKPTCS
jgi:hypothetical protein